MQRIYLLVTPLTNLLEKAVFPPGKLVIHTVCISNLIDNLSRQTQTHG